VAELHLQELGESVKILPLEISLLSFAPRSSAHRLLDAGLRDAGGGYETEYRRHCGR